MAEVFVGLGANLGDREANLRRAVDELGRVLRVEKISSLYRTEPVGYTDQPFFLNAVLYGRTELEPRELARAFRAIENEMGRVRKEPMGPRTLDLDLLLYGSTLVEEADLQVPHPRMEDRRFVLAPLAEIAPAVIHPVSRRSAADMLARSTGYASVERLDVEGWPPEPVR
jgi:2-amino-4-hydroxy-6-hydroxymethyldihydropteridine diphosphokinase